MKTCGFYGCYVHGDVECECAQCAADQTLCDDCTKDPNRARKDIRLARAQQYKCMSCIDFGGKICDNGECAYNTGLFCEAAEGCGGYRRKDEEE